ncbi:MULTISPECIES: YncE family protein [Bacillaceae]|uniref:YncE family protein n=1 Tax=Metabacillus endolithicus TaxID=1535204 RepID=A0ABW5BTV2_9BACI|nr:MULTISPECIES: hypothetical protein [Bacillaceae]PGT91125.1 hypothetical protein COD11_01195 [Bacillus sp. AFS040349]UGB29889.1 hypothetical protein LPC09_19415 [Metabacillus sp. B2-18]UPG64891.1 hypothetical protein MVE64_07615 [Metabacillus endolithicus]
MKRLIFGTILLLLMVSCSTEPTLPKIPLSKSVIASLNIYDQSITFIDADTKEKMIWEVPHPFKSGILLSNDKLLLLNKESSKGYVYQLSTGKSKEWEIGEGIETGLLSSKKNLYLADQQTNKIKMFNLDGKRLKETTVEHTPFAIFENQHHLYVSYLDQPSIAILSKNQLEMEGTIPTHDGAAGGFITEKQELWLGGHGSGVHIQEDIYIYDLTTQQLKATVHAPLMPIDFITKDGKVYVLSHGSNILREIDSNSHQILRSIEVGANPFSMTLYNNNLYISNYDANEVEIIDLNRFKKIDTIPVGDGPLQLIAREGTANAK